LGEELMMIGSKDEILKDAEEKRGKVREYLARKGYDGLLISTREQFAWVTGGGDSHVVRNSSMGFGTIVITKDKAWLVAQSMDAARLYEEHAAGQGYELVTLRWYDEEVREKARALAGKRVASDTDYEGAQNVYADLVDLHYPMTELELLRTRWLASETDRLFTSFAHSVNQGETEKDIAARLHCGHLKAGMEVDVLIVASDERCFKYRHPIPTEKPLKNYLMLHTVARRWGLHCNLTRFVHYDEPQENVRKVYNAAANVEARVFLSLKPGVKFADILTWQKKWYAEQGYPEEWRKHFQGGPTGYVIVDAGRCLTDKVVQVNQPYEWFITVTGTKMGELAILTEKGLEISSYVNSAWPGININTPVGEIIVPDLLIL
jgi:Xaa-Pro dipeptidase